MIGFLARLLRAIAERSRLKRVSTIFFVIAILATFSIPTLSQPAPSVEREGRNNQNWATGTEQKSQHDNRGTEQTPLIIRDPEAETAEQRAKRYKQESDDKADDQTFIRRLGFATSFLAFLTFCGLLGQIWVARRQNQIQLNMSEIVQRQTAIVEQQADHFTRAERGYVKLSHNEPGIVLFSDSMASVKIEVKNMGRTPATVIDVLIKPIFLKRGEVLPAKPNYQRNRSIHDRAQAFLVTGDEFDAGINFSFYPEQRDSVRSGDLTLYIIAYVDYRDTFGGRHRGGYARVFDGNFSESKNNLPFAGAREYNYDRPRVPGEGDDWGEQVQQQ